LEQLRRVIPSTRRAATRVGQAPKSPGLKHRHYSPRAKVILVKHPPAVPRNGSAFIGLIRPKARVYKRALVCRDVAHYARVLFHFFRQCDEAGVRNIYCQITPETGLGHALMDRVRRAARR
jgi:L-threonylcarbamoyladenylate synthase